MTGSGRRSARSRIKSFTHGVEDDSLRDTKPFHRFRRDRSEGRNLIRILDTNLKALFGFGVLSLFVIFLLIHHLFEPVKDVTHPRVITPFPSPKLMDLPQFQGQHRESLYWGTYRPQYYLGIRARTPRSLVAGLMWISVKDGRFLMRHVCQDSDELGKYGWISHNGRDYGHQVIIDHHMTLATSFLKSKGEGSGYGGDWAVRMDVQSNQLNEETWRNAYIFFYIAEEDGNAINLNSNNLHILKESVLALGSREDLGDWQLHLKSPEALEVRYSGFKTPHIHNLSDLVQETIGEQVRKFNRLQLPNTLEDDSNVLVFQIAATIPFETDIAFVSGTGLEYSKVRQRVDSLTGAVLTGRLSEKHEQFDKKFERLFNLTDKVDSNVMVVGKVAIANLLGGIGYFYGQSKISFPAKSNLKSRDNFISYWPAELYTAVPSRSFFPRGFLWDEGFHQLLIWRWDIHICLDIIGHWLDLMNIDGWIPREQILGAEALSKVPEEFVLQHPTNGNPPTLFLVLHDLIYRIKGNKFTVEESNEISSFLDRAFVRLEAWFQWFNTTQSGKEVTSYFWHGRDNMTIRELNPKTLSSGLDDYPRASHPNEDESHLDLRCWMLLAADCMHFIAGVSLKEKGVGKEYGPTANMLSDFETLNQMHYNDAHGTYFDFGNHTEKVRLRWKEVTTHNNFVSRELIREVLEEPKLKLVPHVGYVSLFPFMERIIPPESYVLNRQLDLISNRSTLWTDYGLRSLSKTSSLYMKRNTEHDAPYWRGPIWMNMNYMILSALHHYSKVDGPYKEKAKTIHDNLRRNLIRNVVQNYYQTGYLWEQYDQRTGKGKGAHPFTGWTSLVLLIMAQTYGES